VHLVVELSRCAAEVCRRLLYWLKLSLVAPHLPATWEAMMNAETEHLFEHYGDILRAQGLAARSITNYQYSLKGFVGLLGDRCLSAATGADITCTRSSWDQKRRVTHEFTWRPTRCARFSVSSWNATTGTMCGSHCAGSRRDYLWFSVPNEIEAILDATASLKHRAAFMDHSDIHAPGVFLAR
jgi:hypothetical protein